jgi:hypothetical protein
VYGMKNGDVIFLNSPSLSASPFLEIVDLVGIFLMQNTVRPLGTAHHLFGFNVIKIILNIEHIKCTWLYRITKFVSMYFNPVVFLIIRHGCHFSSMLNP